MLLIKIIFWGIIIYYALKLFGRFILPILLRYLAKRMMSKVQNMQNQATQNYTTKKEGEVTIEYQKEKKQQSSEKGGEYVDFEEVKE